MEPKGGPVRDVTNASDCADPISLASPLKISEQATLKNRLFKSAMSEQLGSLSGHLPTEGLATLYRRWARGGQRW